MNLKIREALEADWRDIPDFEGWYQVTKDGRVRRHPDQRINGGRELNSRLTTTGYKRVRLCCDGVEYDYYVCWLVAETFLGDKPTPKHEINHKDGIKTNDHVSNLEWVTHGENQQHAYAIGLRKCKLSEAKVRKIRELKDAGRAAREIAELFGVAVTTVDRIVARRTWAWLD